MHKRDFLRTVGGASLAALFGDVPWARYAALTPTALAQDEPFWEALRAQFALVPDYVNLESGYYMLQAEPVLEAFVGHVRAINRANTRYMRTRQADDKLAARRQLAAMAGCAVEELVITRNTTESLDTVIAGIDWKPGDEAVMAAQDYGAMLDQFALQARRFGMVNRVLSLPLDPRSDDEVVERYAAAITPRTRLLMISHLVNITGQILPVRKICDMAHARGVPVLVDGSQAAVHMPVDLARIGCDFYAVTGHKLYGPSGSGAIWISRARQAEMRPFLGGGDMIREVTREGVSYADPPMKFEAGTPGIVQQIGLGVALEYLMALGMENVARHEAALRDYARARLAGLNWLSVQGQAAERGAIFSFTLDGAAHAHDISTVLDKRGIAVRAGTHCAMPLMQHLGVGATCRASFALYNTPAEVDALVDALEFCHDLFG